MAVIVHLGKYYSPDSGGIESVTKCLAEGAARHGHEVSVIVFEKSRALPVDSINGVRVRRSPISRVYSSQPLGLQYFFDCLRFARRADIIHLHYPNILAMLCLFFIPLRVKVLLHWHSDVLNKGIFGYLVRPLEFLLLLRSNVIVATSQVYADASRSLSSFKEKIKIVPIGVKRQGNGTSRAVIPTELASKIRGRRIVLSVGRLVPYKGFDVLIDAMAQIDESCIAVIVGDGPLFEKLRRIVDGRGLGDRVLLLGKVDGQTLQSLFENAFVFCLPSLYRAEAFGVVLVEAMSCGVPVIASDIPGSGVTWVNQHGVTGFNFPVGDASALASCCEMVIASNSLRNFLSQEAHRRFLEEFTEERSIARVNDIYLDLLRFGSRC